MSSGYSQQGFALSLGLHLSVVAVVAVIAWAKPFERKRDNIFELIPLGTPGAPDLGPAAPVEFDLPDGPLTEPEPTPAPPRPQPPPQQPARQPAPPPPRPQPQQTPPPRANPAPPARQPTPTPAPAPKPAKQPAKPDRLSYEDFVKQHGRPQPRASASNSTRQAAPSRTRTAPRIDTKFTTSVSGASRTAGSASGSPVADRNEVTLYLANLYDAIERAWDKPEGMELSVAVDIDIAPNGRITNVRIARSSGNAAYDESALAAVRAVGSAGPTPGGVTLLRTLRFNMKAQ